MEYKLYKPNSKNSGAAMSFQLGKSKDGSPCWFINCILQASWNDQKKTGSFSANAKNPEKSCAVKMNANEAGEILSSIKSRIPVEFFHKSEKGTTIIKFTPWDKDRKIKLQDGEKTFKSPAFGLTISKNGTQFKVALEAGETEVLAAFAEELIRTSLYHGQKEESQDDAPTGSGSIDDGFLKPSNSAPKTPEKEDDFEDESSIPF